MTLEPWQKWVGQESRMDLFFAELHSCLKPFSPSTKASSTSKIYVQRIS